MEGLTTIVSLAIIAFGILQIILFFKLWGMTNNVNRIWKKLNTDKALCNAGFRYLQGNIEETEKLLHEAFLKEVVELSQSTTDWEEWEAGYYLIQEKYKKAFKKINKPAPNFEKYGDYKIYLF